MSIAENLKKIKSELMPGVELIAVSKYSTNEEVKEAYNAGHRHFGENKVQALDSRRHDLPEDIKWHFIGHLQRNKVKYLINYVHLIHAVDSMKLLAEINKRAVQVNRTVPCLLQMHVAKEETKFGLDAEEIIALISDPKLKGLTHVKVSGLMAMATNTYNESQIRNEFREVREVFQKIENMDTPSNVMMKTLSMGMSQDYKIAMEEGATLVRIGSAVFKG